MYIYSVETIVKCHDRRTKFHFFLEDMMTIKDICQLVSKKNKEWYNDNIMNCEFKKVWCTNLFTGMKTNENIKIKRLASYIIRKTIHDKYIREVFIELQAEC